MAQPRLKLHELLKGLTEHVYFQAPPNNKMQYPCVIYLRDNTSAQHADNELYRHYARYQVTVIDRDPDSELADMVEKLQYCAFERRFASDDLNHYVYSLFF
jgi:hypothetical protein